MSSMNERRLHAGAHDERGLVGKALVITLLILAVLGVCALDAVSILSARYRTADAADRAAEETAYAYKQSHDLRGACQTAVETVEEANHTARIPKGGCVIDPGTGDVTITVRETASTIVAKRVDALEDLTKVVATSTAAPAP
jgi:hypothetical protein